MLAGKALGPRGRNMALFVSLDRSLSGVEDENAILRADELVFHRRNTTPSVAPDGQGLENPFSIPSSGLTSEVGGGGNCVGSGLHEDPQGQAVAEEECMPSLSAPPSATGGTGVSQRSISESTCRFYSGSFCGPSVSSSGNTAAAAAAAASTARPAACGGDGASSSRFSAGEVPQRVTTAKGTGREDGTHQHNVRNHGQSLTLETASGRQLSHERRPPSKSPPPLPPRPALPSRTKPEAMAPATQSAALPAGQADSVWPPGSSSDPGVDVAMGTGPTNLIVLDGLRLVWTLEIRDGVVSLYMLEGAERCGVELCGKCLLLL